MIFFNFQQDLVGCFKDQPARTLNIGKSHSSKMTIGKCRAICEKKNAKYYGLEVKSCCLHKFRCSKFQNNDTNNKIDVRDDLSLLERNKKVLPINSRNDGKYQHLSGVQEEYVSHVDRSHLP